MSRLTDDFDWTAGKCGDDKCGIPPRSMLPLDQTSCLRQGRQVRDHSGSADLNFHASAQSFQLPDLMLFQDRMRTEECTGAVAPDILPDLLHASLNSSALRWNDSMQNNSSRDGRAVTTPKLQRALISGHASTPRSLIPERPQMPIAVESHLFTFIRYFEETNESRDTTVKSEPHETMMEVVTRLQGYLDMEVFVFSKADRKAIQNGLEKIVFKLPQVHDGCVTFSKLQFGEIAVSEAVALTSERPVQIEVLTRVTMEGKSLEIF